MMAFRRTGDKPLSEPIIAYWQLKFYEPILMKIESEYSKNFIHENASQKCRR